MAGPLATLEGRGTPASRDLLTTTDDIGSRNAASTRLREPGLTDGVLRRLDTACFGTRFFSFIGDIEGGVVFMVFDAVPVTSSELSNMEGLFPFPFFL